MKTLPLKVVNWCADTITDPIHRLRFLKLAAHLPDPDPKPARKYPSHFFAVLLAALLTAPAGWILVRHALRRPLRISRSSSLLQARMRDKFPRSGRLRNRPAPKRSATACASTITTRPRRRFDPTPPFAPPSHSTSMESTAPSLPESSITPPKATKRHSTPNKTASSKGLVNPCWTTSGELSPTTS